MKNILTLDVGNSNYQCIIYQEDMQIRYNKRVDSIRDPNQLDSYFKQIQASMPHSIDIVVISSVIPHMTQALLNKATQIFQTKVIKCQLNEVDLDVKLPDPNELGADFIASAIAVKHKYPQPTLIIDMGTANKVSLITNEPFALIGGIISPGIGQQFNAYTEILSHLSQTSIQVPKSVIGTNTIECIQSGITYGTLFGLYGICDAMEKELNQPCYRVITGGYNHIYSNLDVHHDPTLVNDGLYYLGRNKL